MTQDDLDRMATAAPDAAKLLRLLSHKARLMVLCSLKGGERTAGELVAFSGLSQSALSQHLARLRTGGIVETRRDSQQIYYRLKRGPAEAVIATLYQLYCANPPAQGRTTPG